MESIKLLFFFILVLCVSHYIFFSLWNHFNRPITEHKFFKYDDRVDSVSNCLYKSNVTVCGNSLPTDLRNRVTRVPLDHRSCSGRTGLIVGGHFLEQQTDFESLERWCFHAR